MAEAAATMVAAAVLDHLAAAVLGHLEAAASDHQVAAVMAPVAVADHQEAVSHPLRAR